MPPGSGSGTGEGTSAQPLGPGGGPQPPAQDALQQQWQAVSKGLDADCASGDWGAAELLLRGFLKHLPASSEAASIADKARVRSEQLAIAGDSWFQKQVADLPQDSVPGGFAQRLSALSSIRDVTLEANRAEADARYQQALGTLTQQLAEARRQARVALESGRFRQLPALAQALGPIFADTPVVALQRAFASLCQEAAAAAPAWRGNWSTTQAQLGHAGGEASLCAAAALILAGEGDGLATARRLLADPALQAPQLIKRKEAMLGHQAAVLAFKDPADLQYIDASGSEPRLEKGALRGDDAANIACTVPLAGGTWERRGRAHPAQRQAERGFRDGGLGHPWR